MRLVRLQIADCRLQVADCSGVRKDKYPAVASTRLGGSHKITLYSNLFMIRIMWRAGSI
jgi:hypothetical protein